MSATFDIMPSPFGSRSSIGTVPLMRLPNSFRICCMYSCWDDILFFSLLSHTDYFLDPLVQNIRHAQESYRVSMGHHVEHVIVELASGHQFNHRVERGRFRHRWLSC